MNGPAYPDLKDLDSISSPSLWVDRQGVKRNIEQMIIEVGGPEKIHRLRPHAKTHKMREVIEMQVGAGIKKCKAATPREAEVVAEGGVTDILIAHQLVGPKIDQVRELMGRFPDVEFSSVVDDEKALETISHVLGNSENPFPLWIDVDCGMHRSGIPFGDGLDSLRSKIESTSGVAFAGLHVYDGHVHDPELEKRRTEALEIIETVRAYLSKHGETPIVGGGTPSFGIWAKEADWECSPGTTFFWDWGYGSKHPDLEFEVAAGVIARVISKPGADLICLDLGHKSVAAEMALEKRVVFPEIENSTAVGQSEEHLVLQVPDSSRFEVGQVFMGIPAHICPTVALHAWASIFDDGIPSGETWEVAARNRM